jgi:hypothetical protein
MFADMRCTWTRPRPEAAAVRPLRPASRSTGPAGERLYGDDKGETEKKYQEVQWPAVTRHPVTGRSILFVNPCTRMASSAWRDEAWPLIEELAQHATRERFVYYHRWRVGDVLMWDERATMHRGAGDYRPDERRIMLRDRISELTPVQALHIRQADRAVHPSGAPTGLPTVHQLDLTPMPRTVLRAARPASPSPFISQRMSGWP